MIRFQKSKNLMKNYVTNNFAYHAKIYVMFSVLIPSINGEHFVLAKFPKYCDPVLPRLPIDLTLYTTGSAFNCTLFLSY